MSQSPRRPNPDPIRDNHYRESNQRGNQKRQPKSMWKKSYKIHIHRRVNTLRRIKDQQSMSTPKNSSKMGKKDKKRGKKRLWRKQTEKKREKERKKIRKREVDHMTRKEVDRSDKNGSSITKF